MKLFHPLLIGVINVVMNEEYYGWWSYTPTQFWYPVVFLLVFTCMLYLAKKKKYDIWSRLYAAISYGMFGYLMFNLSSIHQPLKIMSIVIVPCLLYGWYFRRTTRLLSLYMLCYFIYAILQASFTSVLDGAFLKARFAYALSQAPFFYLHDKLIYVYPFLFIFTFLVFMFASVKVSSSKGYSGDYYGGRDDERNRHNSYDDGDDLAKRKQNDRDNAAIQADNARMWNLDRNTVEQYDSDAGRSWGESNNKDSDYNYHPERSDDDD
ncbi:hypothetical protein [Cohnella abietis]|nr:hypothetical protein [Cohnella abietis]